MASPRSQTPAKAQTRYERVVRVAEAMLAQDGEQGLQMKQLALRSEVALGTLYRYFPSKDHVLGAIAVGRCGRALDRAMIDGFGGNTPGERLADMLLREFRAVQRSPEIAAALQRFSNATDRTKSEFAEAIALLMWKRALIAVEHGGTSASQEQRQMLRIALAVSNGAACEWLSGIVSAEEARSHLWTTAQLLDLPDEIVRTYLMRRG